MLTQICEGDVDLCGDVSALIRVLVGLCTVSLVPYITLYGFSIHLLKPVGLLA